MKSIYKKIITMATAVALILCSNSATFAAETSANNKTAGIAEENEITPRNNSYKRDQAVNSSQWTTIATSPSGFNCNVEISTKYCTTINYISVIMYSGNNQVWSETNCIPSNRTRVFHCGSNVTSIKVKCTSGGATVSAAYTTKAEGIY